MQLCYMTLSRDTCTFHTMRYESPNPVPAIDSGRLRARHRRARAYRRLPTPPSGTCTKRGGAALLIASWLHLGQAARCQNRVGIFGPYSTVIFKFRAHRTIKKMLSDVVTTETSKTRVVLPRTHPFLCVRREWNERSHPT